MAEREKTKARTLDGKALAAEIRSQVAAELQSLREKQPGFQPGLTIVQVVCRKHNYSPANRPSGGSSRVDLGLHLKY